MAGQGQADRSLLAGDPARLLGLRGGARVSDYTSATDADREEMLAAIGVGSIEDLFADIPADLRLSAPLDLDAGLSEQEVYDELRALAARNVSTEDEISFLGAGMYDHYVPALIDAIVSRSERSEERRV